MPQITLARAGQFSDPIEVGPGTRVTATGGYVQWTTGTLTDVRNGVAIWQTWPAGAVAGYQDTLRRVVIRGVATGAMTLEWDESKRDEGAEGVYWQQDFSVVVSRAKFDGVTDDWATLQAEIDALNAPGVGAVYGGALLLPAGVARLSQTLKVKDRVRLIGRGRRATKLLATAAFPVSTPLVQLGPDAGAGLAFDCRLEDLNVDCNAIAGSIGVIGYRLQEGCGLWRVGVFGFRARGVSLPEDNNANWFIDDAEIYSADNGGAEYGLYTRNPGAKAIVRNITIVGGGTGGAANLDSGIFVDTAGGLLIEGAHFEGMTNGIHLSGNDCAALMLRISGPAAGSQAVTTLVRITSGWRGVLMQAVRGSATNVVVNATTGETLTDTFLPAYIPTVVTRGVTPVPNPVGSISNATAVNAANGSWVRVNTLTENTTIGVPSNAVAGMELTFRFVQDGAGGRTVAWNAVFKGITLAASGTAGQRAVINVFYDGTNWIQVGTSGWVT